MAIQFIKNSINKAKRERSIFEDKSKVVFKGPEPETFVIRFKDPEEQFFAGAGVINNFLSEFFFKNISLLGVDNYFIKRLNMREQVVRDTDPMSFDVCIHHVSDEDFSARARLETLSLLPEPILEFRMIDGDKRHVMSEDHLTLLGHAHEEELEQIRAQAKQVFTFIAGHFYAHSIQLMNLRLRFSRQFMSEPFEHINLLLCDSIDLHSCALWDIQRLCRIDLSEESILNKWEERTAPQEIAQRFKLIKNFSL